MWRNLVGGGGRNFFCALRACKYKICACNFMFIKILPPHGWNPVAAPVIPCVPKDLAHLLKRLCLGHEIYVSCIQGLKLGILAIPQLSAPSRGGGTCLPCPVASCMWEAALASCLVLLVLDCRGCHPRRLHPWCAAGHSIGLLKYHWLRTSSSVLCTAGTCCFVRLGAGLLSICSLLLLVLSLMPECVEYSGSQSFPWTQSLWSN